VGNGALVYSRPESLEWGPAEGLGPDIVEGIRRIESQDGPNLILSGSSTLTSTLLEHGLADEVLLVILRISSEKSQDSARTTSLRVSTLY
jgi:dihydrofolate reductase